MSGDPAGHHVLPGADPVDSVLGAVGYKPGWTFKRAGPNGSRLCVFATTPDSSDPARDRCTQHQFPIPAGLSSFEAAARWVFDCLLLAELHEAGEFFTISDFRPYFPHHQDEGSPYELVDRWHERTP